MSGAARREVLGSPHDHDREGERAGGLPAPPLLAADARAVLAAACAVLLAAVLALPSSGAPESRTPGPGAAPRDPVSPVLLPSPRVLLTGARVTRAAPVADPALAADGALALDLVLDGRPGTRLLSARVELPGTAVVLGAVPAGLDERGAARLALEVLPTCPGAVDGLARAAVVAVVRGAPGRRVREARVRLDPGALAAPLVARCGTDDGLAPATAVLAPDALGAQPGRLAVEVPLTALGPGVQVQEVLPGPGLAVEPDAALPLALPLGETRVLRVGVRTKERGCGGAPDTPPFVLRLGSGETVAPSVDPQLRELLAGLRPYRCTPP